MEPNLAGDRPTPATAGTEPTAAVLPPNSALEKPLHELTEDDIAQVTREDCRRFLKQKGMRRPSWNKSQAIQQVISLKALLEIKTHPEVNDTPTSPRLTKVSSLPPAPAPEKNGNSDKTSHREDLSATVSPRVTWEQARPSIRGQMTVFYGGKVNVFDGVPSEKAFKIMRLAAGEKQCLEAPNLPLNLNQAIHPPLVDRAQTMMTARPPHQPPSGHPSEGAIRLASLRDSMDLRSPRGFDLDGPTCRKASLQRYLDKRKDRKILRCKRNLDGMSLSDMDAYLIQKLRCATSNLQWCQSGIGSPTHPKPPHTPSKCNSFENQAHNVHFSIDCDLDDVPEG